MKRAHVIIFLLCILSLFAGCGRIGKDVTIDGLNVSGLTRAEAEAAVAAFQRARIEQTRFTLTTDAHRETVTADALGVAADVEGAVKSALSLKKRDAGRDIFVSWAANDDLLSAYVAAAAESFARDPADASVQMDPGAEEPFDFTPERPGATVDEAALTALLRQTVSKKASAEVPTPVFEIAPAITLDALKKHRQPVSSFTTSFAESPYNNENRVFNIKKAAAKINGTILEAGEEFNCNEALGDRNETNGWRQAPGIVNGAYQQEYGGGVCQVSSTLFNAVLMADLPVTERYPHSWPMGYVEIGRDATISTGGKNFRFKNASGGELYLFARVDGEAKTVTVSVYGAPLPEGKRIELSSEQTGWLSTPGEAILLDESLPQNTRTVSRKARRGRTARTYKKIYGADGTLLSTELSHEDTYRTIDGVTYVSTDLYEA